MLIHISETKKPFYDEDGDELSGECAFLTPRRMSIRISRRQNRTINKFAGTLLHEMLHAWMNILERKGFNADGETEEAFVLKAEGIITRQFNKKFNGR
jgi:hypothetical protein